MTRKVYRTAQGKMVDLGALQLRNENVRAVGNMNVNARGDLIDSHNRPIRTRNDQVGKQYRKQTTNVSDTPVASSRRSQPAKTEIPEAPEDFFDDFEKTAPAAAPTSGLAAAIARAREIKQEPITPPSSTSTIKKL
jgi:hypothetical protein